MGDAVVNSDELDEDEDEDGGDSKDAAEDGFGLETGVRFVGHSNGAEEGSFPVFSGAVTWMVIRSSRGRGHKVRIPLSVQ